MNLEETERKPRRMLIDVHETVAKKWFPFTEDHYPTMDFTRQEGIRLQELRSKRDLPTLRALMAPISFQQPPESVPHSRDRLLKGTRPLAEKVRALGIDDNFVIGASHAWEYFGQYRVTFDARRNLPTFKNRGYKITFSSGTPVCCGGLFLASLQINGLSSVVDPEYAAVLRPGKIPEGIWPEDKVSPIASKLIAGACFEIIDGRVPIYVDDVTEINELAANILGATTCNPRSKEEAESLRKKYFPKDLKEFVATADPVRLIRYTRFSKLAEAFASEEWNIL